MGLGLHRCPTGSPRSLKILENICFPVYASMLRIYLYTCVHLRACIYIHIQTHLDMRAFHFQQHNLPPGVAFTCRFCLILLWKIFMMDF